MSVGVDTTGAGAPDRGTVVLAITRDGIALAGRLVALLPGAQLLAPERFRALAQAAAPGAWRCYSGPLRDEMAALCADCEAIVAVCSIGALVRLMAPHLRDKHQDPAVVVLDEAGRFAIPVLSGHLGGANALADRLARALGATPVLTTASDVRQTLAVDLLGRELGWTIQATPADLLRASAAMVNGEPVALMQEAGGRNWWRGHANGRAGPLPENLHCLPTPDASALAVGATPVPALAGYLALLWISDRPPPPALPAGFSGALVHYLPGPDGGPAGDAAPPAGLALGLGCDRGTPLATLTQVVSEALAAVGADIRQVQAVASIDLKADEAGLIALGKRYGWQVRYFSAAELARVQVPNPSETVRRHTGTPSVSEAAALLAAGRDRGPLLLEKFKLKDAAGRHATVSIAMDGLMREDGQMNHTNRPGRLLLVGIGPGAAEQMTVRARNAIAEADLIIGHATYLRLVADLIADKVQVKSGMTEELDRVRQAVDLARAGRTVALISSGDSGVYGMAGLTFEFLLQSGWTPDTGIEVEVVPGTTALGSCAALVGAPLSHDFCAISLSDLLTPWPVIARRLDAAAAADFVIALYNPRSGRRTQQLREAQRLLLAHRPPDTPAALVHAAYRPRQRTELTTLAALHAHEIGMQTTVLIGNSQTLVRHGLMVTPRGYSSKYALDDGTAVAGERTGQSLSTGLDGWRATLRASGQTPSALARRYQLPEAYIASVLASAEPEDGDAHPSAS